MKGPVGVAAPGRSTGSQRPAAVPMAGGGRGRAAGVITLAGLVADVPLAGRRRRLHADAGLLGQPGLC